MWLFVASMLHVVQGGSGVFTGKRHKLHRQFCPISIDALSWQQQVPGAPRSLYRLLRFMNGAAPVCCCRCTG